MSEKIDKKIELFKSDISDLSISVTDIFNKYILHGEPYIFEDDSNKYYSLKKTLADKFEVSITNIFMVGSSKLGFSLAPHKLWNHINEESDIDVVIISDVLYDKIWINLLDFNINLTSRNEKEQEMYQKFLEYFFKGWLRPDKFPFNYSYKNEWFDFFSSISYKDFDKRKITGAIYRSEHFFRLYHLLNIEKIRKGSV